MELSGHFLPAIDLYPTQQKTGNVCTFVIANIESFKFQIFGVVGPLGENFNFLSPLGVNPISTGLLISLQHWGGGGGGGGVDLPQASLIS